MGDLTKNLSRHEVACNCGCGFDTLDIETARVVQEVCDHFKTTVTITSGCRCATYNKKIGGAARSQHVRGRALDCKFKGVKPEAVAEFLQEHYADRYGFKAYATFIHIDTRSGGPARW